MGMANLHYVTNVSLDGYIEDARGAFDWMQPDDEQFTFVTDLVRPVGTYLYGRRLYESMAVWETDPSFGAATDLFADFAAVWQGAEKIVWSTTLDAPVTARTQIARCFDAEEVRHLTTTSEHDLMVGGADIAAQAFAADLVDECHLFVAPCLLGGGKPGLPSGLRVDLELLDARRFDTGIVYLRHRVVR